MLSQCICYTSETYQILSPVLFQQSLYFPLLIHRIFYLLVKTRSRAPVVVKTKQRGMATACDQCAVCGTVILQACSKYRLTKVSIKPEETKVYTKVGQVLLNVAKSLNVAQTIAEDKLISSCCCIKCYKFIMKVNNTEQQLFLLRSELESKIKNTCIKTNYKNPESIMKDAQNLSPGPLKRLQVSPLSKTGVTPPSKRQALLKSRRSPLQPTSLGTSQVSTTSKTGITSQSQSPTSIVKRPVISSTLKQLSPVITPPSKRQRRATKSHVLAPKQTSRTEPVTRRELFPMASLESAAPAALPFQEEINIPVYTDLESDPNDDIKVSTVISISCHCYSILPH